LGYLIKRSIHLQIKFQQSIQRGITYSKFDFGNENQEEKGNFFLDRSSVISIPGRIMYAISSF
jgi:hypothetical protein